MGLVSLCEELSTGDKFAVKTIRTRDDEIILNLKNEFNHLVRLRNEHIIRVHELLIDNREGTVHLIMEYAQGRELFEVLSEIGHYDGRLSRGRGAEPVPAAVGGYHVPAPQRSDPPGPEAEQRAGLE